MTHKDSQKENQEKKNQPEPKAPAQEQAKELEKLNEQINQLQKQKDELFQKFQRLSADYANYQKRVPKQIADQLAYEKDVIIRSLLPALDDFDRMLTNADSAKDPQTILDGMRIIYKHTLDILKSHGVQQINAVGENFDPASHQALMHRAELDKQDGIILDELQKGYSLNGRVVRPGKVIVNKLPPPRQPEKNADKEPLDTDETTDREL